MAAETEIRTFLCRSDNIGVLIRDPQTGACAAIDVPEAGPVLRALNETGWRLTDILVTHRHGDHVEGIPEVKRATGARVVAPAKAGDAVPQVDVTVREGNTVTVGRLEAQVWETPGHCADHVTYWFAQAGLVCAGDTLFTLGCGRVMESPPETLYRSLRRFDVRVRFLYLDPAQRRVLAARALGELTGQASAELSPRALATLDRLTNLTPGDFAVVVRRSRLLGHLADEGSLLTELEAEARAKTDGSKPPVGFAGG